VEDRGGDASFDASNVITVELQFTTRTHAPSVTATRPSTTTHPRQATAHQTLNVRLALCTCAALHHLAHAFMFVYTWRSRGGDSHLNSLGLRTTFNRTHQYRAAGPPRQRRCRSVHRNPVAWLVRMCMLVRRRTWTQCYPLLQD